MHVLNKEGLLKTKDGMILFQECWSGAELAKGAIVLVHGYGEHSGRYKWFARQLVLGGYSVHAFDQRSHGKSEGLRAFIPNYNLLLDDLESCVALIDVPPERIYLFGQGTGAGIVLNYSAERECRLGGVILSGPIFNHPRPSTFTIRFLGRLAALAFPRMRTLDYLYRWNPQALSRRQYAVDQYLSDPFVYHGKIFNRTGWELHQAVERGRRNIGNLTHPLLILHGGADHLADPGGSREFHKRSPARYKSLKIYPDAYHDLLQDNCREQVVKDVLAWMNKRAQSQADQDNPGQV